MKKLSRFFTFLLVLALGTACNSNGGDQSSSSSAGESAATGSAVKVGIVQLVDNGAFTDMREGFIDRMREIGYSEADMVFDYKNAQGDMTNLNSICQSMADSDAGLIVTIATPPTQAMVNQDSGKPVFFISVSDPVAAKVIGDMNKPDKNATGTSNFIPVEEIFKLSDQLTPNAKNFGILYNASEINSINTVNSAKEYMDANGYTYKETTVTSSSEVQQAAQLLADSVDAFFIPNDSMIQSALPQVAEIAKEAKIPIYGSSAVMVASGAFATVSIDDRTIGAMTADMVEQHLKGAAVEDIPAVVVSEVVLVVNKTTADAIGVELSPEILESAVILE